ncbi:sulfate transporter [Galendromus occidentalis]|uniref:Sulfate transporter n=1 Tax=Galendromus occidentalis TaxID=34638 RepID=A0AAJ6QSS4_9ACAR|nr:sulfate transporter [Galendromus occidentalis]
MKFSELANRIIQSNEHHSHDGVRKHNFSGEDFKKLRKCCSESSETPICRPVFDQPNFNDFHEQIVKEKPTKSALAKKVAKEKLSSRNIKTRLLAFFPIITWLGHYNIKADLFADVICGLTVAIFHVPQTLGYSLLVGVNPINGLYTAIFPMLMYSIFGTSRHNSIGAFAVVCVMTSGVVQRASKEFDRDGDEYAVTVVTTLAFFVGIFQLVMGVLNMGGLSVFLSEQFVSGFTAGVSVHIGSSQLGGLFGIKLPKYTGPFLLISTYIDFFKNIGRTHVPTLSLAIIVILVILAVKHFVDPYLLRKFHMPLPIEIIVVIICIIFSNACDLKNNGFDTVLDIPNSFLAPKIPEMNVDLIKFILVDSILIAIISFTVAVSLGKIWARDRGYEMRPNQEFFALGISNFFGSVFGCFPAGASVPRSSLQLLAGGRTQLVSLINSTLLIFVVLALGKFLIGIPKATLSAIIVVSLKKIFMQVRDFKTFWRLSVIDGHVWLVAFFATVVIDVVNGLVIGVVFSLLTLVYKVQTPQTFLLGNTPNSDYYVPLKLYAQSREVPGVKIFQYGGPLHFANTDFFKSELLRKSDPNYTLKHEQMGHKPVRYIVLDFSRVTFIDGSFALFLRQLAETFTTDGVAIFIADCAPKVLSTLRKAGVTKEIPETQFFPSLHDAVMHTHDSHRGHHRHLASIGRQASFNETFGPDSLATVASAYEHRVDVGDENGHAAAL